MAMAMARKLSLSSGLLVRRAASMAAPPVAVAPSAGAKVADRIVKLFAIDLDGRKNEVVGLAGQTLLKALCNAGLIDPESHRLEDIDACSAECEVRIASEWLEKLPPPSYEETYVLTRASRSRVLNKHSRLGCQIVLTPELRGMVVAIPEPKPWDIP
ncbi:2Fe-2S ferredoxin-like superfamily protein [Wolffia australiana]